MEKTSAGIDLGTTNSCLAVLQDGKPVVIRNDVDEPTTPSIVSIQADGPVVGKTARKLLLTQPTSTFASIKRKMGQRYSRSVLGKEYTPESISAVILRHLKDYGERRLSLSIDEAVITVPAHFNSSQRQATRDAGEIAGLKVLRVINEPTAAALAYAHMHQLSSVLLVFDLGGGTFDISVVEAGDGVYEVLHSAGDNHLGGDDFNLRIVRWIVEEFRTQSGIDIRRDASALALVHEWAITAKHTLTDAKEVTLRIENLAPGHTFQAVLTRGAFEAMCRDLFERLRTIAGNVVAHLNQYRYRDAYPGVFSNRLEGCDILLVGGETRVPAVRQLVWECFNGKVRDDVNPDEVVAMGAALQAGIIQRRGDIGQVVLVDTTALSLGTAVQGGIFSRIIDANTKIPCSRTQQYVPLADYIPYVQFGVYQGESDLCANNVKLAEFQFPIQPPRPREQVVFALTYALDADDILHVTAVETGTGAKQEMSIRDSQNLDRETISRLRREAEESRGADQLEVQRLQRRQWLYEFLREVTRHIPALTARDPRSLVLAEVVEQAEAVRIALDGEDEEALEQAATNLEDAWNRLGMALPPRTGPAMERPPAESALPPMTQGTSGADMVACGHCGASLPPGFAFCGKCGMPLKKENCSKCGAALVEGFAFCGKCGTKVD